MVDIQLTGPGKNALGSEMMRFLLGKLQGAAGEPVLLRGSGDALSAGLNLKELAQLQGEAMLEFLRLLEETMVSLYLYPGPTVALVSGHAIAGGCILALCCDWRVGAQNPAAKIGLNEVALGLRFPPRTFAIVRRRLPAQHAEEVLLGAGLFDPQRALALGLLDELAADAEAVARARLAALSAHPRHVYAQVKRDLRGTPEDLCPAEVEERVLRESTTVWDSDALRDKIAAILNKR